MRMKLYEPIFILGEDKFKKLNIRIQVSGGGPVSQIYAIRQALAKGVVAYQQKYVDEESKRTMKEALL